LRIAFLVALSFLAALPITAAAAKRAAAVNWTGTVAATPAGGFRIGNPAAKVKLVEYGSMTCPHCRAFDEDGTSQLIATYVKSGKVSFEFRNYVRDPVDLAAALIARCNGARTFFPLTRALFKEQDKWFATMRAAGQSQLEQMQSQPPARLGLEAAKLVGIQAWAAAHGVAQAKTTQCLTNTNEVKRLVEMRGKATQVYPDFHGTPSFVLNGKILENTATWDALEPRLRRALGERS
jgi:protein-disulfide isomerase